MTADGYIGWGEDVYGDALGGSAFPDCDPPPTDPAAPFVSGSAATGFGTSSTSKFAGKYIEPSDLRTGLSGQPVQSRYPGQ
jgi:hypothetical protein